MSLHDKILFIIICFFIIMGIGVTGITFIDLSNMNTSRNCEHPYTRTAKSMIQNRSKLKNTFWSHDRKIGRMVTNRK